MQKQLIKSKKLGKMKFSNKIFVYFVPIVFFIIYLFGFILIILNGDIHIESVKEVLTSKKYIQSFLYSTNIVVWSIFFSITIGTFLAKKINLFSNILVKWIAFIPYFVIGFYIYEAFHKIMPWSLNRFGFPIILSYIIKAVPFVILYLLPVIEKIPENEYAVIKTMGASNFETFKTVIFPRLIPAYVEITIILLSFIYTAYEIPFLLGISFPKFIGIIIYNSYFQNLEKLHYESIALMFIMSIFLVSISLLLMFVSKKYRKIIFLSEELK